MFTLYTAYHKHEMIKIGNHWYYRKCSNNFAADRKLTL